MKKNRKGITLIEALFVLGIMAILIGIVMILLSQTTMKTKVNQTIQEYASIQSAVKSLCDGNPSACLNNDLTSAVANSGLLASRYVQGGNIFDPFGQSINNISLATSNSLYYITFQNDLSNLQKCTGVVQYEMMGNQTAWTSGGNIVMAAYGNGNIPNPKTIISICQSGFANTAFLDY